MLRQLDADGERLCGMPSRLADLGMRGRLEDVRRANMSIMWALGSGGGRSEDRLPGELFSAPYFAAQGRCGSTCRDAVRGRACAR